MGDFSDISIFFESRKDLSGWQAAKKCFAVINLVMVRL
jgi:hypothetical protein